MKTLRRRALLTGAAATFTAAAAEYLSLRGLFDHRQRARPLPQASLRYRAALAALERDHALDALVHIGHSTHLLALGSARILTDPWFNDPAHGGIDHARGPAVGPESVGRLDVIAISHEHPDHLDPKALDRLDKRALCLLPTRQLAARMRKLGFAEVEWLAPYASLEVGSIRISAVPALHDVHEIGFVLERAATRVYFAGDTALHPEMDAIAERFAPTAAILPVDGSRLDGDRRWVMNPAEAANAAQRLGAGVVIPSHAEAHVRDPLLSLWLHPVPEAARRFRRQLQARRLDIRCHLPAPGAAVSLKI
ncbi:MAG: MBL fold metallo-hydrolase [Myxococcales bacterium]|nr:MBL fold metallo-hydrolase [Myxococcales bacterium]